MSEGKGDGDDDYASLIGRDDDYASLISRDDDYASLIGRDDDYASLMLTAGMSFYLSGCCKNSIKQCCTVQN